MPERRCLGCGLRTAKGSLARFVVAPNGAGRRLVRDDRAELGGRGLYTCPLRECFTRAVERRGFQRGARVRGEIEIDPVLSAEFGR